ncbi:hypothetical protein ACFOOM_24580 [Streptomyces echinoruber]|uniref:Uncharacterized protein n=1 Tax=Streptomyces echinoruber TaxID=68898 RepID=A0A918R5F0_9ACTN|nr:hypothetical protein [Streptomyces echinoruber]GGZ87345.1 hypothetical protein GCM10010389_27150 [Streptomyces echinoruber]
MTDFQRFQAMVVDEGDTVTTFAFGELDLKGSAELREVFGGCLTRGQQGRGGFLGSDLL